MPEEKEKKKPLTKAQEVRKTTKPIMEKKRRARINASLCELKALLLDVMKKEGARTNKMEKADILEMTVKHLRTVQRQQFETAVATDPTVFNKYQSGFNECATEVSRYLGAVDGIDAELRSRLLNHLANCVTSIDNSVVQARATPPATAHVRPMQIPQQRMSSPLSVGAIKPAAAVPIMTLSEINNNVIPGMNGLAVAGNSYNNPENNLLSAQKAGEERLKSGDVAAFVIPSNILSGGQMPGYIIPLYSGQAGKFVQQPDGSNKVPTALNLPTVVPVPLNLQHSPPQTYVPQSPNSDLKGMDLTTDNRNKTDRYSQKVEEQAQRDERVDIKVPIPVPAQRNVAPAGSEPMWRPW